MKIHKELLKGSSEIVILKVISSGPLYGYEIAKHIKEVSKEIFEMGEGTLYPILHKLEKSHLLQSYWQEVGGRRRKYYELTPKGKAMLQEKTKEWETFSGTVNAIIHS